MNNNFKKGFTLVEIMIAVAAMGGLSLVLMQLNKGSLKTQGDAVLMADYVQLQKEISFIISDNNSCTASLGATLGPPIVTGVTFNGSTIQNTPITGLELWSANQATPPIRSRKRFYESLKIGKLTISSISFSMPDYTAGVNFSAGTQSFKGELKISGSKSNMGSTKTFPDIIQSINVTFNTNAAGLSTIKSCSADVVTQTNALGQIIYSCPIIASTGCSASDICESTCNGQLQTGATCTWKTAGGVVGGVVNCLQTSQTSSLASGLNIYLCPITPSVGCSSSDVCESSCVGQIQNGPSCIWHSPGGVPNTQSCTLIGKLQTSGVTNVYSCPVSLSLACADTTVCQSSCLGQLQLGTTCILKTSGGAPSLKSCTLMGELN